MTMTRRTFKVNGKSVTISAMDDMPLLWVLRDQLQLLGTHYGCGIGQCGACTVHLNGKAVNSCTVPFSKLSDVDILTIEGLSANHLHPVQQAWIEKEVTQCGYCQSGQIMTAIALLNTNPKPNDTDINNVMRNVLCRCGTYPRIRKAIHHAIDLISEQKETS